MESLVPDKVGMLGVSNTDVETLRRIYDNSGEQTKPSSVQNRFTQAIFTDPIDPEMPPGIPYPEDKYDASVRKFCAENGIKYTPWGILWGSPELLEGVMARDLDEMAEAIGVTKQVVFFACMQDPTFLDGGKTSILCGTKTTDRMTETIDGLLKINMFLAASDGNLERWTKLVQGMRKIVSNGC